MLPKNQILGETEMLYNEHVANMLNEPITHHPLQHQANHELPQVKLYSSKAQVNHKNVCSLLFVKNMKLFLHFLWLFIVQN